MTGDVALVGDWNIAPQDDDVFDIAQFAKSTHVTPPERAAFQAFLDDGYVDVVRPFAPGPEVYTYWDYYRQRFERNRGMRIDFVLGNPSFAAAGHRRLHRPRRARRHRRQRPRPGGRRPGLSVGSHAGRFFPRDCATEPLYEVRAMGSGSPCRP